MNTSDSNVLTRYQAYRTRRFIENDAKTRHWLPKWRTQRRRRMLAIAVAATLIILLIISICSLFLEWVPIAWFPATALFLVLWTMLQTVSGRHSDAPTGALDEWEVQQRNEARSIGLTITQGTVLAAIVPLIFLSTTRLCGSVLDSHGAAGRNLLTRNDSRLDHPRPRSRRPLTLEEF